MKPSGLQSENAFFATTIRRLSSMVHKCSSKDQCASGVRAKPLRGSLLRLVAKSAMCAATTKVAPVLVAVSV